MSDERRPGPGNPGSSRLGGEGEAGKSVTSSRARNRTVMLTPEMTGHVRALLYNEEPGSEPAAEPSASSEGRPDPLNDVLSSGGWSRPERSEATPASTLNSGPAINDFAPLPQDSPPSGGFGGGFSSSNFDSFNTPSTVSGSQSFGVPQNLGPQHSLTPQSPSQARTTMSFGAPALQSGGSGSLQGSGSGSLFQGQQSLQPSSVGQSGGGLGRGFPGMGGGAAEVGPLGIPRKERSTKRFQADEVSQVQDSSHHMGLAAAAAAHVEPQRSVEPQRRMSGGKVIGFLVSFDSDDNGEAFDIRSGRLLITCRPTDQGDYLLIDHPTVSPLHAIIRATKEGKVEVLDQLSEYGTGIIRAGEQEETEVAGARMALQHGDVLRFGERRFVVCLVPAMQRPASKSVDSSLKEGEESVAD